MNSTPRPFGWLAFLGGAGVFLAAQWWLFRTTAPVPNVKDSGWFLNSDAGVAAISIACAIGGLLAGLVSPRAAAVRYATLLAIGAASAMTLTLFRIGPGTIFPVVIVLGGGIIAYATAAGAGLGVAIRRAIGWSKRAAG